MPEIAEQTAPALCLYQDAYAPAPPPVAWPLDESLWLPHVDTDDLVTFTIVVPLSTVVAGTEALYEYCEEAFNGRARTRNTEFRAIGSAAENEDFDAEFVGDITLQVTCSLESA